MALDPTGQALKQDVLGALDAFQSTLKAFTNHTKQQPRFLRDHNPPPIRADGCAQDARVYPDRTAMMKALARGPVGAEIGVQRGNFSRMMLDDLGLEALHLIDINKSLCREDVLGDPRSVFHEGFSDEMLATLPEASLDWAYIDADHSYKHCSADIKAALPKVKSGGVMFFNDYTMWSMARAQAFGVVAAVNEFINTGHDLIGFALSPSGFFDVAVRRS